MGGPGKEAGSAAPYFAKQFASLLTHRDLLLVDQRGTGKSAALRCDLSSSDDRAANLRDYLPLRAVKRCEQQVREQADPTQYTYTHFAHDLDQVRRALVESLRAALYRAEGASAVPWMIHEAYKGNWNPIVESILAYASARSPDSDVSFGLFLNITCNDDVAFIREEEIGPATQGTYLGDYRVRQQQAACETWPKVTHAADYRKPVHSSVPTMFVSGAIDPAAPPWYTQHVAPGFENRVEIVEQNQWHTEWNPCVGRLYELFVKSASTRGIDTNCEAVPRPPFKIQ